MGVSEKGMKYVGVAYLLKKGGKVAVVDEACFAMEHQPSSPDAEIIVLCWAVLKAYQWSRSSATRINSIRFVTDALSVLSKREEGPTKINNPDLKAIWDMGASLSLRHVH